MVFTIGNITELGMQILFSLFIAVVIGAPIFIRIYKVIFLKPLEKKLRIYVEKNVENLKGGIDDGKETKRRDSGKRIADDGYLRELGERRSNDEGRSSEEHLEGETDESISSYGDEGELADNFDRGDSEAERYPEEHWPDFS